MTNTGSSNTEKITLKTLLARIPDLEEMLALRENEKALTLLNGLIRGYYHRTGRTTAAIISQNDYLAKTDLSQFKHWSTWEITTHLLGQLKRLEDILYYNRQEHNHPNYKEQNVVLQRIVGVRGYLITVV